MSLSKYILLLAITLCAHLSFAQPEKQERVERNGKEFFVYKVERGKTFYSLEREYKVSSDEIIKYNPNVENGLKKGETIYIPVADEFKTSTPDNTTKPENVDKPTGNTFTHTVAQGETLYGISRKYDVEVNEILKLNPEAKDGLSIGQKLKIPGEFTSAELDPVDNDDTTTHVHTIYKDSIVMHVVQEGETMYSLSKRYMATQSQIRDANDGLKGGLRKGDTLRIPIRMEVEEILDKGDVLVEDDSTAQEVVYKDIYNVVVMVPFQLDKNAAIEARRRSTEERELYFPTKIGVDFLGGVQLALDSLSKAGISVSLNVYDTYKDTGVIAKLLKKEEVLSADLIIGPFHSHCVNMVADFALENKIHMVIPVPQGNKVLFKNPYVSKAVTSTTSKIRGLADYIVKNYPDANIILVDSKIKKDEYLVKVAQTAITENLTAHFNKPIEPKMSYVHNYEANHMKGLISKDRMNIVVAISKDQGFATNFMTKINGVTNSWDKYSADIKVFGLDDWEYFNSIDDLYKKKLDFHYVSNKHIDYDTSMVQDFILDYREKYGYDPSDPAYMGFDVAYNYVAALAHYGSAFPENVGQIRSNGIHTKMNIEQVQEESGFENRSIYIVRYNGFKLELVE